MGGGSSVASTYRGVYHLDPTLLEYKKDFETLCLKNSDVKCLYDIYQKIDNSNSNAVEIDAIFLVLGIENEFIRKIFVHTLQLKMKESMRTILVADLESSTGAGSTPAHIPSKGSTDTDNVETISFDIFVYAVWTVCSLQPSFFELFAFDVYLGLLEGGGKRDSLDSTHIQGMLADIYGPRCGQNFHAVRYVCFLCCYMSSAADDSPVCVITFLRAMSILKDNDNIDDYFDIDDFYDFTFHNNVVQFAIFSLQTRLQGALGSFTFWEVVSERRYRTFYGYSCIAEILRWGEFAESSSASAASNQVPRKFSAVFPSRYGQGCGALVTWVCTAHSTFLCLYFRFIDVFRQDQGAEEDGEAG